MSEYGILSPKRVKLIKEQNLCALNLTRNGEKNKTAVELGTNCCWEEQNSSNEDSFLDMRNKFQQWVLETYKDASKTKTITAKKYERIVKTLRGEIKNCAENSKFRFWMKCKGFKLESDDRDKSLYVLDKKGEELKYKKVAMVENFFDIIYNVHVNEGARGIKHAGQKRTHRSITETYAFLPREAVTKFLLCCVDCQKRTNDERKNSPSAVSSSSSHDSTIYQTSKPLTEETTKTPELCTSELIFENPSIISNQDRYLTTLNKVNTPRPDYERNPQCNLNANNDRITITSTPICNENLNENLYYQFETVNLTKMTDEELDRLKTRKRKRKFTRKIIRPTRNNLDSCDMSYDLGDSSFACSSSTPYNERLCKVEEYVSQKTEYSNDNATNQFQDLRTKTSEFFTRQFLTDGVKFPFATNVPLLNVINTNANKYTNETAFQNEKSNYVITDVKKCPYIAKITDILNNPFKYTIWKERVNDNKDLTEESFLEQLAIEMMQKAMKLDQVKRKLTEIEKEELSMKIDNCRVVSFLVNYAADLMLKTLCYEIS